MSIEQFEPRVYPDVAQFVYKQRAQNFRLTYIKLVERDQSYSYFDTRRGTLFLVES